MKRNFGIIIEARTQSTRFKNKIFNRIGKNTILLFLIKRLNCAFKNKLFLATTNNINDKKIIDFCIKNKIPFYVGSENDLIHRVINTAIKYKIDNIVSLTSDNPLVEPKMINHMLKVFFDNKLEYFDNLNTGYLPRGTAIRIIKTTSLIKFSPRVKKTKKYNYRQHTTIFFIKNKKKRIFKTQRFNSFKNYNFPDLRLTIDFKKDLDFINKIMRRFKFSFKTPLIKIINQSKKSLLTKDIL